MNLRCIYCQTPFTLGRVEMLAAIVSMNEKNMNHYDAHCPRCRRANSISRQRMELFYPTWKEEAAKQPAVAPAPTVAAAPPASTFQKTEPLPKGAKEAAQILEPKKPAAKRTRSGAAAKKANGSKSSPAKKLVAKKPAVKKATTSKPATKKAPAKGKKK